MNSTEKITSQEQSRSEKIAHIVSRLPENEQEKIYYMIKGVELAGTNRDTITSNVAV